MTRRRTRALARCLLLVTLAALLSGCFASPPQIIALDPNRGSVGVPGDAPITVQFDRQVRRESVVGRFDVSPSIAGCDLTAAFSARAGAPCRIVWLSGDTGFTLFHPRAVLLSSRTYTFILRGGFADPEGAVNTVDHRWDVTTASAPQVVSITPSQGTTDVLSDLPLAVSFTSPMALDATTGSITLNPPIPGTRVVRNPRDKSRFLVLPGRPLQPGVTYQLTVGTEATDEHGQALAAAVSATFTAAGLSPGPHAVVLAGRPGAPAREVIIASLAAGAPGDPIAPETELVAPDCPAVEGCGSAPAGEPLYAYLSAALSPNAQWLAAVEQDLTSPGSPAAVVVINAATRGVVRLFPDASMPSWAPDSSTLAFATGGSAELYQPASGRVSRLPAGDPLLAPPVWEPRGELVVLSSGSPSGVEKVELADALVEARYPVPGLEGLNNSNPAVSPDGTQLAVYRSGAGPESAWLVGIGANGNAPPRPLAAEVLPVGWTDPGTVLGIAGANAGRPTLVQVSVSGGGILPVSPQPPATSLGSVSLASSGRLFGFLATDAAGTTQVEVESIQGGSPVEVTAFIPGDIAAQRVTLS